jgi:formylglycine-generating enzyme required for sulfatase activity/serine/threonine protein kinase
MDKPGNLTGSSLSHQITADYNIIRLLGKGGMGEVYLAEQLRVGRRCVALKVLNRACSDNPDLVKRFENEAASAGRIHHNNVVMVYECRATDDGQLYVAMEYVEGLDLGTAIKQRGNLAIDEVVEITKQAAAGLAAAHRLGIVHRDVKPDNIMLTRDEDDALVVKVLDFGIARLSETDSAGGQTKTGVVMGTPYYMSPEQALGNTGDKIDSRSDIYSLAMVVYQMLTGKVAFEANSWMLVMYKHINEAPQPPSLARPDLNDIGPIEDVVLKGLEKDREKRQQDVRDFAGELEAAYAHSNLDDRAGLQTALYPGSGKEMPFARVTPPQPAAVSTVVNPLSPVTPVNVASAAPVERISDALQKPTVLPKPTERPLRSQHLADRPSIRNRVRPLLIMVLSVVAIAGIAGFVILMTSRNTVEPSRADREEAAIPPTHAFSFSVFTVNDSGQILETRRAEARYFTDHFGNGATIEMVAIPEGSYLMGVPQAQGDKHPDESPQHEVSIEPFYIGRTEVTRAQWTAVAALPKINRDLDPDPSSFNADGRLPVQNVGWFDAVEFCARLSNATGRTYGLPTEAEWEYACRAGTTTPFHFGPTITADLVNYDAHYPYGTGPRGVSRRQPTPVGNLGAANAFGLNDMHGNIAEWCLDGWHENYNGAPGDGRDWTENANMSFRVIRGGSWSNGGEDCRSSVRHKYAPDITVSFVGFRVVAAPRKSRSRPADSAVPAHDKSP